MFKGHGERLPTLMAYVKIQRVFETKSRVRVGELDSFIIDEEDGFYLILL